MSSEPKLYDHETEQQVVGNALFGQVADLSPSDFHDTRHQSIWRQVRALQRANMPVSLETVQDRLNGTGPDETYWTDLMGSAVPTGQKYAVAKVRDLANRRHALNNVLNKAARDIINGRKMDEIASDVSAGILRYATHREQARPMDVEAIIDDFLDRVANPQQTWGMKTGFYAIDSELGGLHKGEVFKLAGPPKLGKSALTTQMGFQLAGVKFWGTQQVDSHPGAMYHLEMSESQLIWRLGSAIGRVNTRKALQGRLKGDEQGRFQRAVARLQDTPVYISDSVNWTTTAIRADVARLIREHGVEWVLIDYAGRLKDEGESELVRQDKISQGLADIAKMGVAVIAVETVNKARGDMYGSIGKQYDAHVAAYLRKDEDMGDFAKHDKDVRWLEFDLVREGPSDFRVPLRFIGAQRRFEPHE